MKFKRGDLAVIFLTQQGPCFPAVVRRTRGGEALELEISQEVPGEAYRKTVRLYRPKLHPSPPPHRTEWVWTGGIGHSRLKAAEFLTMGPWRDGEAAKEALRPYRKA